MWSPGGSPRWAKGGFPVHSFVGLGLLPLGGRAGLIVGTGLCVQEGRDGSFKKKSVWIVWHLLWVSSLRSSCQD